MGDLLSQDTTGLGAVINLVTGYGKKARISTEIKSICSVQDTSHKQPVENSPGREIPPKTCQIREGDKKGDIADL